MSDPNGLDTGHDYDGIRELDNQLPNWWLATLWVAVVFGAGYWMYYHTGAWGETAQERLEVSHAEAKRRQIEHQKSTQKHELSDRLLQPGLIAQGKSVYASNCASCHGLKGEGGIGPNLTDKHWLHGGAPEQIHRSVAEGWPNKGMMAWAPILGPSRVDSAVAYVLSMKGSMEPGKAPEGELE